MKTFGIALAVLLAASSVTPLHAGTAALGAVFSDKEIAVIRSYYREHADAPARHGKGGSKRLPPGIAKNLRAGKPLPPGIAKRGLPGRLLDRLPPPRDGFERIEIAGKILLVEIATQVIHDVIEDIVFR